MKFFGSEHTLGAIEGFAYKAMNCSHMPNATLFQRRRRELCEIINSTVEQLRAGVLFYYPPVYPHGLDYTAGHLMYRDTIPFWWYQNARVPDSVPIVFQSMMESGLIPSELFPMIAVCLQNPAPLVMSCTSAHRRITMQQPALVAELSQQNRVVAELISWWGHQVWTRGRMPVIREREYRPEADMIWRRHMEELWADDRIYLDDYNAMTPAQRQRFIYREDGPDPREEEMRWYTAENFLTQAQQEAMVFGERVPVGVTTSDDGFMRLLFSDSDMESDEMGEYSD